jgi:hypothetical protein
MPMALKTVGEINNIIGGNGAVDLTEAVLALGATTGIVAFSKKIGLWPKLSPVERHEAEMLDEDKPEGWWRWLQDHVTPALFVGKRLRWRHDSWSVGLDDEKNLLVTTPILDEESDTLI